MDFSRVKMPRYKKKSRLGRKQRNKRDSQKQAGVPEPDIASKPAHSFDLDEEHPYARDGSKGHVMWYLLYFQLVGECSTTQQHGDTDNEMLDSDGCSADEFYVILDNEAIQYDPCCDLDEFVKNLRYKRLQVESTMLSCDDWTRLNRVSNISFVKMHDSVVPIIKYAVVINRDLSLNICVNKVVLDKSHGIYCGVNSANSIRDILHILLRFELQFDFCVGGRSDNLVRTFRDHQETTKCQAFLDTRGCSDTVRSLSCTFLVDRNQVYSCPSYGGKVVHRCQPCQKLVNTLYVYDHRDRQGRKALVRGRNTRNDCLNRSELISKCYSLAKENKSLRSKVKYAKVEVTGP